MLGRIAAVEVKSEHPIARAIVEAAGGEGIAIPDVTNFESVTGFGVKAHVNGEWVEVGADRYMRTLGLEVDVFAATAERLGHEGTTPPSPAIDRQGVV